MDDLLIDSADERLVRAALAERVPSAGIGWSETDARLGLTRLVLGVWRPAPITGDPDVVDPTDGVNPLARELGADPDTLSAARTAFATNDPSGLQLVVTRVRQWVDERPLGPLVLEPGDGSQISTAPHVKGSADVVLEPGDAGELVHTLPHVKGASSPVVVPRALFLPAGGAATFAHPHVKDGFAPPAPTTSTEPWLFPGSPDGPRVGIADARPFAHPAIAHRLEGDVLFSGGPFGSWLPGHATFVAGTILRRAPRARVLARAVIEPRVESEVGPEDDVHVAQNSVWDVARRLARFADDDIDVLNMSWAVRTDDDQPPLALQRAVARLYDAGVVLVAAGGNADAGGGVPFPAGFDERVIAVGAGTPESGLDPDVTQAGDWLDLLAPGTDVTGLFLRGAVLPQRGQEAGPFLQGYAVWSGTSFAAAAVTGEIARRMTDTGASAAAVAEQLVATGGGDIVALHARA